MLQYGHAPTFHHHFLQLHICTCTTTDYLCLQMCFSFLLYKQHRGISTLGRRLSGSVCTRATASTAPQQFHKKINLFVTDSSILRRLELMFYLLEFCWIQCRWSTARMSCRTNRLYCTLEYGANKSHLCYLWMHARCTLNAFVWAISLNHISHISTTMYNMQESMMLLVQPKEKKVYTWAKKLHFLMTAWRNIIEGHYWAQEYIPEKCVQH